MRTQTYSDFLSNWGALIGVPVDRISTEVEAVARVHFNSAMRKGWKAGPWLDVSPRGEARFVGNKLSYAKDLTKWTGTNITATANALTNPLDQTTDATKLLETTTNGAHKVVVASLTLTPSQTFLASVYARRNGRDYIQVAVSDGAVAHTAFYNLAAGTVGTTSECTATATPVANGYVQCQLEFTASASATVAGGSFTLSVSTDGSTLSYAGDTAKGVYAWGGLLQQTSNVGLTDTLVGWEQTGEKAIDAVFTVWQDPPSTSYRPRIQPIELTPNGIQLVSTGVGYSVGGLTTQVLYGSVPNPVFLHYRKQCPSYSGSEYSATATYAVGDQIWFTDSSSVINFWKCVTATSAGESPTTTAAKWELLEIPEFLFWYAVYQAYGDWLISDGQMDKAQGAYAIAQGKLDDEHDRIERQMGWVMRTAFTTHTSTQYR